MQNTGKFEKHIEMLTLEVYNCCNGNKENTMKNILKILVQLGIIYAVLVAGNLLNRVISPVMNIPGNILGMMLMFILLCMNIVKMPMIEETGNFLLKYMGFFFIPSAVGIMDTFEIIRDDFIKLIIILIISCIVVMYVTCKSTDFLITLFERKKKNA